VEDSEGRGKRGRKRKGRERETRPLPVEISGCATVCDGG